MSHPTEIAPLYHALESVADEFEATAREAEQARAATERLATALRKAQVPLAKVPRAAGGYELSPAQQIDYFARLSYLNPTAGWLAFNQAGSLSMLASRMEAGQLEKLLAGGLPLIAAVSAPTGQSRPDGDGYRVSGRWQYASGASVADYVVVMTICTDPPGPLGLVLPREGVTLHDDWHVGALQGTGSVEVVLEDVFVPRERTTNPFGAVVRGGAQYLLGYKAFVAGENFGFSLGVAQRFLDEVTDQMRHKRRLLDPGTVGERGAFQMDVARAWYAVKAGRALMVEELTRAVELTEEHGMHPEENRLRVEGAMSWATDSLTQACTRLFPYAGAGALHLDNPIQRTLRDLIGSGQHYVATNQQIEDWGKYLAAPAEAET